MGREERRMEAHSHRQGCFRQLYRIRRVRCRWIRRRGDAACVVTTFLLLAFQFERSIAVLQAANCSHATQQHDDRVERMSCITLLLQVLPIPLLPSNLNRPTPAPDSRRPRHQGRRQAQACPVNMKLQGPRARRKE